MEGTHITIGIHTFRLASLQKIDEEKCVKLFKRIPEQIVRQAWKTANPTGKKATKQKKRSPRK